MEMIGSIDPATGELVGEVAVSPLAEIPSILARARAAQPEWAELGVEGRAEKLAPLGEMIVARAEDLLEPWAAHVRLDQEGLGAGPAEGGRQF